MVTGLGGVTGVIVSTEVAHAGGVPLSHTFTVTLTGAVWLAGEVYVYEPSGFSVKPAGGVPATDAVSGVPSGSLSLVSTLPAVGMPGTNVFTSGFTSGAWLAGCCTRTLTVAFSHKPAELHTVYVKLSAPVYPAVGVYV